MFVPQFRLESIGYWSWLHTFPNSTTFFLFLQKTILGLDFFGSFNLNGFVWKEAAPKYSFIIIIIIIIIIIHHFNFPICSLAKWPFFLTPNSSIPNSPLASPSCSVGCPPRNARHRGPSRIPPWTRSCSPRDTSWHCNDELSKLLQVRSLQFCMYM